MQAKLIVVGGKANKGEVAIELPATIGRSRDADLTVGHRMISRKHCEAYLDDGLVMIRDVGSLNGIYVRGHRVRRAPLPPGATFTIGPITFRIDYEYSGDLSKLPPIVPAEEMPEAAANQELADSTEPVEFSTEPAQEASREPEEDSQELMAPRAEAKASDDELDFEVLGDDDFELAGEESPDEAPKQETPQPAPAKEESPKKEAKPKKAAEAEKDPEDQLLDDFLNDLQ